MQCVYVCVCVYMCVRVGGWVQWDYEASWLSNTSKRGSNVAFTHGHRLARKHAPCMHTCMHKQAHTQTHIHTPLMQVFKRQKKLIEVCSDQLLESWNCHWLWGLIFMSAACICCIPVGWALRWGGAEDNQCWQTERRRAVKGRHVMKAPTTGQSQHQRKYGWSYGATGENKFNNTMGKKGQVTLRLGVGGGVS